MPSTRKLTTKAGKVFYEISVSRGRGLSRLTTRWYPPEGWSQKAITRELAKVAAEFEQKCDAGEVISRAERKTIEELAQREAAKILTLKQYGESVFMPTLSVRCSENTRCSYQAIWITGSILLSAKSKCLKLVPLTYLLCYYPCNQPGKVMRPRLNAIPFFMGFSKWPL